MGSRRNLNFQLVEDEENVFNRPSIDKLMVSAAKHYEGNIMGIILSGFGTDGLSGLSAIRERGGVVVAQDANSVIISEMPRKVIESGLTDHILALNKIGSCIASFCGQGVMPLSISFQSGNGVER
jgi:two-component system chemotaxis response regulator CheB